MNILRDELKRTKDGYEVIIYLDTQDVEFASESGPNNKEKQGLTNDIQAYVKKKYPKIRVNVARVMLGGMLVSTIPLSGGLAHAAEANPTTPTTPPAVTQTSGVKTSADFTDLVGIDAGLKAKVDALLAKGYMEGKTDTTFDITGNMTRAEAAKLVSKVMGLTVGTETKSSFADVSSTDGSISWSIPYIEAAKKAGIIDGMTDTTFAPKDNVTLGQLATMFVKGLGKTADVKQTPGTPWYQGYMDVAKANGIDLGADGSKMASRADLVSGSYAADVAVSATQAVTLSDVKATGAKQLTVTFNKAVDDTKAVFAVKKGTITTNIATTTFSADKKTATLELSSKLTDGDYAISVSGLSTAPLTKTITAVSEKVSKIEFLSQTAPLSDFDADGNIDGATVGYKVTNQYGEDITSTTDLTSNSTVGTPDATAGKFTIAKTDFATNDKVSVTLIHPATAVSATATLTVSSEAKVADISIVKLYNKDGKQLNEDTNLATDKFYLLVDAKDQYGTAITNPAKLSAANLLVNETNNASTDAATAFTTIKVDGVDTVALPINAPAAGITVGSNIVTLISTTSGKSASLEVKVVESVRSDVVNLTNPGLVAANEDVYIGVEALDKTGKAITDVKTLNDATKGTKVTVGSATLTNPFELKDGAVVIKVPAAQVSTKGVVSLIAVTSSNKVSTLTLNVKDEAIPTVIRGVDADFGKTLVGSASTTVGVSNLVVEDQYGRVMTDAAVTTWLDAGNKILVTEDENATVVAVGNTDAAKNITSSGGTVTPVTVTAGAANGTEKLTFTLVKAGTPQTASAGEVTMRVTDGTEYVSYSVDTVGTVYDEKGAAAANTDAAAYDKAVKVYGVLADGSKVLLSVSNDYTITSTNSAVQTDVSGDSVIDQTTAATYGTDKTEVVAPITVTINATGQQFNQDVTISKVAPSVKTVKFVNDNTTSSTAVTTMKHTAGAGFSIANITAGNDKTNIVVTDQYGVSVVAAAAAGDITFADGTTVAAPRVTITPVTGAISITNNGLANAAVTASTVTAGDVFDVTVTYAGGATSTVRVTVE
ncbi:S-layer homology domain-containing protein [Paenibacillus roseipurpureus]|uniref:S-layer homology domain-containing protein n=1 Tax=Paenibacillus roseopurpureus TaxID=2918901 RepID=A0AA96LPJ9_9BACL|nr:S-layer homology domain-containing protein [Paenibacillus sp. MBLB1832]WNR44864.1 S-layer homology domain-containing protein [Paenibacillus sp. MBLB1832]